MYTSIILLPDRYLDISITVTYLNLFSLNWNIWPLKKDSMIISVVSDNNKNNENKTASTHGISLNKILAIDIFVTKTLTSLLNKGL